MDDVPDSFTTQNAPALTTVEPDDGPHQQGYRKMARKQTTPADGTGIVSVYGKISYLKSTVTLPL